MEKMLKDIGQRIVVRRKELGYTQEQIAEMMDVSVQMVSNLERGNKAIRIDNLIKLSEILRVSTDYILTGKHSDAEHYELFEKMKLLSEEDFRLVATLIARCGKA